MEEGRGEREQESSRTGEQERERVMGCWMLGEW